MHWSNEIAFRPELFHVIAIEDISISNTLKEEAQVAKFVRPNVIQVHMSHLEQYLVG